MKFEPHITYSALLDNINRKIKCIIKIEPQFIFNYIPNLLLKLLTNKIISIFFTCFSLVCHHHCLFNTIPVVSERWNFTHWQKSGVNKIFHIYFYICWYILIFLLHYDLFAVLQFILKYFNIVPSILIYFNLFINFDGFNSKYVDKEEEECGLKKKLF